MAKKPEQKLYSIYDIKPGEIITRVTPKIIYEEVYNETLGITKKIEKGMDFCGVGKPLKYKGIANGRIYFEEVEAVLKGEINNIFTLFEYENGWAKYIDPKTLGEPEEKPLTKEDLEGKLTDLN